MIPRYLRRGDRVLVSVFLGRAAATVVSAGYTACFVKVEEGELAGTHLWLHNDDVIPAGRAGRRGARPAARPA